MEAWRLRDSGMTACEALHPLVDELPDEHNSGTLVSLDRGLSDVSAGRLKPLPDYERERGL